MGPGIMANGNSNRQQHHVALGWVRHDEALTKMAASCWSLDRFTDVTIFCEDRVLHAHRLVLASMSPLLASLLSGAEGPDTAILLPEVKGEDMRLLLQFIYQGEVVLPPRRTAALLDLAALLCIAGVRGGGTGHTPPSPPRSDTPDLDPCEDNREDQVSDDEHQEDYHLKRGEERSEETEMDSEDQIHETETRDGETNDCTKDDDHEGHDESSDREDVPINLAAKPETKINDFCSRPKPCSSSPPDFTYLSASHTSGGSGFVSRQMDALTRAASLSYYQHPALRGCHPFSLELAVNNHRNGARTPDGSWPSKRSCNKRRKIDSTDDSDVEVHADDAVDDDYDSDREIDLSVKTDLGRMRSDSAGEDKMSPASDVDNSSGSSSEGDDQIRARNGGIYSSPSPAGLSLANKMLLMPPSGSGNDPRRSYLEAVLQESLVQQSYTIVLPSHMGVTTPLPLTQDQLSGASNPALLNHGSLESKAWNLAGKTAAELQCLQGLLTSRMVGSADSAFTRSASVNSQDSTHDAPTNLSTHKNSVSSTKRNSKEGYSCQVCRKVFTSSSNLAVHSMIHSGTKPFKCDMCSWSFRQKAHLQKHMRHIHKIIVAK